MHARTLALELPGIAVGYAACLFFHSRLVVASAETIKDLAAMLKIGLHERAK